MERGEQAAKSAVNPVPRSAAWSASGLSQGLGPQSGTRSREQGSQAAAPHRSAQGLAPMSMFEFWLRLILSEDLQPVEITVLSFPTCTEL